MQTCRGGGRVTVRVTFWGGNAPAGNLKLGCPNFVISQKAYMKHQSVTWPKGPPTGPKRNKSQTNQLHSCPKCFGCVCCVLIYHKQAIRTPGPAARHNNNKIACTSKP